MLSLAPPQLAGMEKYTDEVEAETYLQAQIRNAGAQVALWKEHKARLEAEERKVSKAKYKTIVAERVEPIVGVPVPKTPSGRRAPATPGGRKAPATPSGRKALSTPGESRKKKIAATSGDDDKKKRSKKNGTISEEDFDAVTGDTLLDDLEKTQNDDEQDENADEDMSALDRTQ